MPATRVDDGEPLTPADVARRMGVQVDVVYAWIEALELEAVNVARPGARRPRWRISERAYEKFVSERSTL